MLYLPQKFLSIRGTFESNDDPIQFKGKTVFRGYENKLQIESLHYIGTIVTLTFMAYHMATCQDIFKSQRLLNFFN